MIQATVHRIARCALVILITVASASAVYADRCETTGSAVLTTTCTHHETQVHVRWGNYRDVRWQVPEGTPPAGGWPVVVMYHGKDYPITFSRSEDDPYGGYNTSRMARTWPNEFEALVIQSASYATCAGPLCSVPSNLSEDHPPTYFLHGYEDETVPWWTMDLYYDALIGEGIPTGRTTNYSAGHEWIPEAPAAVLAWFNSHG